MNIKTRQQIAIAAQTAKFLTSGGKVQAIDHTANNGFQSPAKRSRKDQVEWAKRNNRVRGRR